MSELEDLVAVFGRIDDAVVQDPDLLPKVAEMLPQYRHPGVSGWYQALQDWQRERGLHLVADRDFGRALTNLPGYAARVDFVPARGKREAWATRDWLNGRRMLATATIGRIQGYLGSDGVDLHDVVSGIADDIMGPEKLHDHLRKAAVYPKIEAWPMMMADIGTLNLVKDEFKNSGSIPPVASDPGSFRVVPSPSGESVALRTHFHAVDLTLAKAMKCLKPADWTRYKPPWCAMKPFVVPGLPPGTDRYEEEISADCTTGNGLKTILNFQLRPLPDGGGILQYRIPEDLLDQDVSIDEGSLEVRPAAPGEDGIHFVTTKRIQFKALRGMPEIPAAVLGFWVWVLGWNAQAELFLYSLARDTPPPSLVPTGQGATDPQGPVLPQDWKNNGVTTLLDLGFAQLHTCLRGCVVPVRSSMERAASGNYGITDYLSDLTKLSNEVTDKTTALATLGAQMCRSVTDSGGQGAGGAGRPPPAQGGPPTATPTTAAEGNSAAQQTGKATKPAKAAKKR